VNSENELCSRPDLFAFQIGSGVAIFYCGVMGISTWHRSVHRDLPSTPEGRLFGYLAESELLAAANFTFQVWDFFVSLMIPEHATAVFLLHHVAAALVSWFSLSYQVRMVFVLLRLMPSRANYRRETLPCLLSLFLYSGPALLWCILFGMLRGQQHIFAVH